MRRGHGGQLDLRRNAAQGRVFWEAAPSQWYAEPKRLAALGYLDARKEPGRTRERTHYTLTDRGREALDAWVRTPASLPRMQHETVVRLLAADLVPPAAVWAGLPGLRADVDETLGQLERARAGWGSLEHRRHLLEVNDRYAERLMRLHLEWLEEAEAALRTGESDVPPDNRGKRKSRP